MDLLLHDAATVRLGRLFVAALVAVLGTAWAHHPVDVALPAGTALCVDERSVRATITSAVGGAAAAEAAAVATTAGHLERILAAYGREHWLVDACDDADAYLQIELTGRVLDPERYRGFDPMTYSLSWSARVSRPTGADGPRTERGDVLASVSGSDLHSEERSDETVDQRLAREALPLATEMVHAAVIAGGDRPASRRPLLARVATAVLAATALVIIAVAVRRRRAHRRPNTSRREARFGVDRKRG